VGPHEGGLTAGAFASTARPFDVLAARYDDVVESNPIHRHMRARSLAWLDAAFRPGMRVLEIGCGTGTEAVHLARRGVRVLATDASSAMVDLAVARVKDTGLADLVEVRTCPAGELADSLKGTTFDGAYASFGALNCEPDLAAAVTGISRCVHAGADFLLSVVSRPSVTEIAVAAARFRMRKAFRRLADAVPIDLYGSGSVRVRAYGEGDVRRALRPSFDIVRIEGWLVALPPPYVGRAWDRVLPLHRPLASLDARLGAVWPFRGWGDHLHVWARRAEG